MCKKRDRSSPQKRNRLRVFRPSAAARRLAVFISLSIFAICGIWRVRGVELPLFYYFLRPVPACVTPTWLRSAQAACPSQLRTAHRASMCCAVYARETYVVLDAMAPSPGRRFGTHTHKHLCHTLTLPPRQCAAHQQPQPPLHVQSGFGSSGKVRALLSFLVAPRGERLISPLGLNEVFRKTKRKTEGPQHFAFPEISRENRG